MKRQQRRMLSWKILAKYTIWEEGMNQIHILRKHTIRCFLTGKPNNYTTYVHPQDEERARQI